MNAAISLLLLLVPVARETLPVPNTISFDISCNNGNDSHFILSSLDSFNCQLNSFSWSNPPDSSVTCGTACKINGSSEELLLQTLPLSRLALKKEDAKLEKYLLPDGKTTFEPFSDQSEQYLFCEYDSEGQERCSWGTPSYGSVVYAEEETSTNGPSSTRRGFVKFGKLKQIGETDGLNSTTGLVSKTSRNVKRLKLEVAGGFVLDGKRHSSPICTNSEEDYNYSNENGSTVECSTKCLVQLETAVFCSNKEERKVCVIKLFLQFLPYYTATTKTYQ
jgi:hypothetical protein